MIPLPFGPSSGDVLYRRKSPFYEHVGLYLGGGLVFQNTPEAGEHIVTLEGFSEGQSYRAQKTSVPQHLLNWRVHLRLREPRRYHLFLNNCEHSVFALTEGKAWSPQLLLWGAIVVAGFCLARR
jgi:hypothetical protein